MIVGGDLVRAGGMDVYRFYGRAQARSYKITAHL